MAGEKDIGGFVGAKDKALSIINEIKKTVDQINSITTILHVDKKRIDTYMENGSMGKPFKTIQAAIDEIAARGDNVYNAHPYEISIAGGIYTETLVFEHANLTHIFIHGPYTEDGCAVYIDGIQSKVNNDNLKTLNFAAMIIDTIDVEGASNGTGCLGNDFMFFNCGFTGTITCYNTVCAPGLNACKPDCDIYITNCQLFSIGTGAGHNPFKALHIKTDTNLKMPTGFTRTRCILRCAFAASPTIETIRLAPTDTQYAYVETRVAARVGYSGTNVTLIGDGSKYHTPAPTFMGGGIIAGDGSIVDLRAGSCVDENIDLNDTATFEMRGGVVHGNIDVEGDADFHLKGVHVQGNITLQNVAPLTACVMDGGKYMGILTDVGARLTRNAGA